MKKYMLSAAIAIACGALAVAQENPQTRPTQPGASASQGSTTTLVGCLYRASDVQSSTASGTSAGASATTEGFVIADAKPSTGASSATGTAGTTGSASSSSASSMARMYKIEKGASVTEDLTSLVGKRVEISGRIDRSASSSAGGSSTSGTSGTSGTSSSSASGRDLPQFQATSIREATSGESCPAKPSAQ